jgi:transcriptional regulator
MGDFTMYVPPTFTLADLHELHEVIRASRLGFLVTRSSGGLQSTPLPLFLDAEEGEYTSRGPTRNADQPWRRRCARR